MASEAVESVEGPFWDYVKRSEYLDRRRNAAAANCTENVLRGDFEWAQRHAADYLVQEEALARAVQRYRAIRESPVRWVGWH